MKFWFFKPFLSKFFRFFSPHKQFLELCRYGAESDTTELIPTIPEILCSLLNEEYIETNTVNERGEKVFLVNVPLAEINEINYKLFYFYNRLVNLQDDKRYSWKETKKMINKLIHLYRKNTLDTHRLTHQRAFSRLLARYKCKKEKWMKGKWVTFGMVMCQREE